MKKFAALFVVMLIATGLRSQSDHIPPCGGYAHNGSICWGYATGRAFGGSSVCTPFDLTFNQISTFYFDRYTSLTPSQVYDQVQGGDIVEFENGAHVSYVTHKSASEPQ